MFAFVVTGGRPLYRADYHRAVTTIRLPTPFKHSFTGLRSSSISQSLLLSKASSVPCRTDAGDVPPPPPPPPPEDSFPHDDDFFHFSTSPLLAYVVHLLARRRSPYSSKSNGPLMDAWRQLRISQIILVLNIAIFLYQVAFAPSLLMAGAKVNSAIAAGQFYRLFSPMFLHASTTHLLINSFSLHSTGPSVESWFGKRRFALLYLVSGFSGNLLSFLCTPTAAVGASGAIFGLVGATAVLLTRHRELLGGRARRALQSLVYIVIMNFGMGLTPGSRIDNFGHLGGFLGGIAYSFIFGPRLVVRRSHSGRSLVYDQPISDLVLRDIRLRYRQLRRLIMPH